MKNEKIMEAYDSCIPSNEVKRRIAKNVLNTNRKTEPQTRVEKTVTHKVVKLNSKSRKVVPVIAAGIGGVLLITGAVYTLKEGQNFNSVRKPIQVTIEATPESTVTPSITTSYPENSIAMMSEGTIYTEGERKITLPYYDNEYFDVTNSGFYVEVEGKDIETITYSLNKGSFIPLSEEKSFDYKDTSYGGYKTCIIPFKNHNDHVCKYIGDQNKLYWKRDLKKKVSEYTVSYAEQNKPGHIYALELKTGAGGTEVEDGITDKDIESTQINMTIVLKNGEKLEKKISLQPYSDSNISGKGLFLKYRIE